MSKGISNSQIENALKNMEDEDINNNSVGAFSSNYMNEFITHAPMISGKKWKYPFIIVNTDSSGKSGTHWWSILDIKPKTDFFFFDSFDLDGLRHFIIQDDKKVIQKKILFETKKMTRTDNKITLVNIRFNLNAWESLLPWATQPLIFFLFKL